MPKVQTSLRIDKEMLEESKAILRSLGLNFSEAVNMFAAMVVQEKGLPFDVVARRYPDITYEEAQEKVKRALNGIEKKEGVDADTFFDGLYRA